MYKVTDSEITDFKRGAIYGYKRRERKGKNRFAH
jgi:hypothetical protein